MTARDFNQNNTRKKHKREIKIVCKNVLQKNNKRREIINLSP